MSIHDAGVLDHATGLTSIHNAYYDIPWVSQRSLDGLRLDGQPSALHRVPSHRTFTIDFFSQLHPAEELVVTFHGANMAKHSYPRFERVHSMKADSPALLAFADPTLQYNKNLLLTWYVGGPGWDPLDEMLHIIQEAMRLCGATRVLFVGGSGGGFPALRLSARLDNSLAFVQSPITLVELSWPKTVETYFGTVWAGREQQAVVDADPARFSIPALYDQQRPGNAVYYLQNLNDPAFIKDHYRPFKTVYVDKDGASGASSDGRKAFVLHDSELERHGPPTPAEFDNHLAAARRLLHS